MGNFDVKHINGTLAGKMAQALDKKDNAEGKADGKISGSVWNGFINDIREQTGDETLGKKINEGGFITLENAIKSIATYTSRIAKTAGKNGTEVAKDWVNVLNIDIKAKDPSAVKQSSAVKETQQTTTNKNDRPLHMNMPFSSPVPAGLDYTGFSVLDYLSEQAGKILQGRKDVELGIYDNWQRIANNGMKTCISPSKNSVAYAIIKLTDNLGPLSLEKIFKRSDSVQKLIDKAKELGINTTLCLSDKYDEQAYNEAIRVAKEIAAKEQYVLDKRDYIEEKLANGTINDEWVWINGKTFILDSIGEVKMYIDEREREDYCIFRSVDGKARGITCSSNKFGVTKDGITNVACDSEGNIICYSIQVLNSNIASEYRNANGDLMFTTDYDDNAKEHYYDAEGKEISEEQARKCIPGGKFVHESFDDWSSMRGPMSSKRYKTTLTTPKGWEP